MQEIHAAMENPRLDEESLNLVLDLVQETGNYALQEEDTDFNISGF